MPETPELELEEDPELLGRLGWLGVLGWLGLDVFELWEPDEPELFAPAFDGRPLAAWEPPLDGDAC